MCAVLNALMVDRVVPNAMAGARVSSAWGQADPPTTDATALSSLSLMALAPVKGGECLDDTAWRGCCGIN